MSKETLNWLNNNVLVGFTSKRGHAWHYKASEQGAEPNHYDGAVPVGDVLRRLFYWNAVEAPVYVAVPCSVEDADTMDAAGNPIRLLPQLDRKAIVRDDNAEVMGLFKSGYAPHAYSEWLLGNVANILSDDLSIGSAGLLKGGAVAWVSVEVPDNMETPEGFVFRPNLLATTSFDGSIATTYKRVVTAVVCDNTLSAGLSEQGQTFKVKHTKHSGARIEDAREALGVVQSIADDFADEITRLCQWEITDAQWSDFLTAYVPIDEDSKRSVTVGTDKRDKLNNLYRYDSRCAPWSGTALGVLQATNTYAHHLTATRGTTMRAERNMVDVLTGRMAESDDATLRTLELVTSN